MKKDGFNPWRDLFGYHDMDFDGDVDFEDVDIEDYEFDETEKALNPHSSSCLDFDEEDDLDCDDWDDDLGDAWDEE